MNQEIKKLWCEALRSGNYKQGTLALYNKKAGTYCCLGVLTDLAVKAGVAEAGILTRPGVDILSLEVIAWAGLTDRDPSVKPIHAVGLNEAYLTCLNDGLLPRREEPSKDYNIQQHTFFEIAQSIEENL